MYRTRSSIPFDILHGIHFPTNKSMILTYLNYFPPPPPVLPGPPPSRSWTCAARASPASSCFVSDDRNPASLRSYHPPSFPNETLSWKNLTKGSKSSLTSTTNAPASDTFDDFFRHHFTLILLAIIFLCIFIFVIVLLLFFVYFQRLRRRSSANNNNESNISNQRTKNRKFYHSLIPYRRKYHKRTTTTPAAATALVNANDENNLLGTSNHDSAVLEVIRLSHSDEVRSNDEDEQVEEAL